MKKIIFTFLIFGISVFTSMLSAQQLTKEQRKAIQTDNIAVFKKQFAKDDYNKCFQVKTESFSPLAYSVMNDKKNIVNFLIDQKVDVNKNCGNMTPLAVAEQYQRTDLAKLLTKKGALKN
ncbi:ankyrin repeat domain-containing protein [Chryseobacterium daecheongense]|uniref:Ankyrin repeat domain-containing protein n=1 Tax=Chryseobacterium daecheongense TaxID=192389 RepID=A0A3N0VVD5_9FLAO|nr:ankyrin repeat domain-containing protein [Chryseobacterium daecheongense]ROH96724.1 ankyrin repeat domain-containing protein [Chryseobacterium daecheongense]TDX90732.1 ankyrin repeat protein [Chryseobacterium daecheongense]UOU99759.1 ankyrin repeat domain-containing protein [Chryseobacterium daecheongense]